MFSAGTGRCSWSLAIAAAYVVVLSSVALMFSSTRQLLLPNCLRFQPPHSSSFSLNGSVNVSDDHLPGWSELGVNFSDGLPTSSHGAVLYRGATWKAEIGRWLLRCSSVSTPVDVVEVIGSKECENNCSFRGVCNRNLGQCRCFHGYAGEGCSEKIKFDCNFPSKKPNQPYGRRVASICAANCDTTKAMCFCGAQSAYPNRPVSESCGFQIILPSESGGFPMTDLSQADENIYTTNSSKPGWCNVDPEEAYALRAIYKQECTCMYDGFAGIFCDIPKESSCISQCSGHGQCHGGSCECNSGWYGIDCSVPSMLSPVEEWPKWLRPSKVDALGNANIKATVRKRRPLIYVYDLPPEFNSHLLEGRRLDNDCVNRLYNDENRTIWMDQRYGAQIALYESILASPHRTMNGDEADYFYIPTLDSCMIYRAFDTPHFSPPESLGLRSLLTLDIHKKVYDHIVEQYPYWNRSSGRDHIWFFSWDEGACYAPKEIWSSMMLVHWGNTNSIHNHSAMEYLADNWDRIPSERRGDHPCFDPTKDLVLPSWKSPDPNGLGFRQWARTREERKTLFYFNGELGPAYEDGRQEHKYSMGIRQKIAMEFGSVPDKNGRLGKQHAQDVIVTSVYSLNYFYELASSKFCGVFPGDGWSDLMEDSILHGCIPVIVQDEIFLPYENVLNYDDFAIRIPEDDIPNMIRILRSIDDTQIDRMLSNVRSIWQRFLYRDSVVLEAARQERLFGNSGDWGAEFSQLQEDDVFNTFIQVLHYKLHNDPWRGNFDSRKKDFGLSRTCLKEPN